jgi:imidazolonepropionase-like amidohydrolase
MNSSLIVSLAALLGGASLTAYCQSSATVTIVHCGKLFDSTTGKVLGPTSIYIAGEKFEKVESGTQTSEGAHIVDLSNATCLPGLIDDHVHLDHEVGKNTYTEKTQLNLADFALRSTLYVRRTLMAGVTTVRNVGDNDYDTVSLRNAIAAGLVIGPRIFTAGPPIGTTGGHADHTNGLSMELQGNAGSAPNIIDGPDEARLRFKGRRPRAWGRGHPPLGDGRSRLG